MVKSKRANILEKYGKANVIMVFICVSFLLINSIIVSANALNQLSTNKFIAYILNFVAGCEGKLGEFGSMSNTEVLKNGQWWRLFTHIYLHAGIIHMLFNVFALLFAGKIVEKKLGSLKFVLVFHLIAVVNAIIVCLIFPNSISVGASAGIFGMIGIVCVLKWHKESMCNELLSKGEGVYIIVFSLLSLVLGLESFVTHLIAFLFGVLIGILLKKSRYYA